MGHGHVKLVEPALTAGGAAARELVPAEQVSSDEWLIAGTPGLVNGCAAGDRVRVHIDGTFEILDRGRNVAAHIYSPGALPDAGLLDLRSIFVCLGGTVEWPATKRFAVITVPVAVGFPAIEEPIEGFVIKYNGTEWNFGNVYDRDGSPLEWWA